MHTIYSASSELKFLEQNKETKFQEFEIIVNLLFVPNTTNEAGTRDSQLRCWPVSIKFSQLPTLTH